MHLLDIDEPLALSARVDHQESDLAIGIDFGTTNSVVCFCSAEGKILFLKDEDSEIIPSIVALHKDAKKFAIGHKALQKTQNSHYAIIRSIKRLVPMIGKSADLDTLSLGYSVATDSEKNYLVEAFGHRYRVEECISKFLHQLRLMAEKELSSKVGKAVITVPAYFDDVSKNIIKHAAAEAGLKVLRLIPEPTAAALGYGFDNVLEGIYVVYDLGGGTFDVSILRIQDGIHQVLAVGGCDSLGGDDFDNIIIDMMYKALQPECERSELVFIARNIKHQLSVLEYYVAAIPASCSDIGSWYIAKSDFEKEIYPLVERTIQAMEETIKLTVQKEGNITLSGVIFVGSGTRIPLIEQLVAQSLGEGVVKLRDADRDRVVALGAALKASELNYGNASRVLIDVVPLSIGLESIGGVVEKIIHRNTPIPVSVEQEFTTFQHNQTGIVLNIVQGERELAADCRPLKSFIFKIKPAPAGTVKLLVRFSVDIDGILIVSATDHDTGLKHEIEICPAHNLSLDIVHDMLTESVHNAVEDIGQRLMLNAKTKLEKLIADAKYALAQDSDLLSDVQLSNIKEVMQSAQLLLHNTNDVSIERLQESTQTLEKATEDLASARLLRALQRFYKQ